MRRLILVFAATLILVGVAEAQVSPGDGVILFNIGGASGTIVGTESSTSGNTFSFSYEKLAADKPVSFLFAVGYTRFEDDSDTTLVHRQVSTLPMYVGAKGWLGKGKVQGFLGATLALSFTEMVTTFNDNSQTSVSTSGFGMGFPIGGTLSLGDTFLIDAQYTLNWVWSNEAFENDIVHAFSGGIGFRL